MQIPVEREGVESVVPHVRVSVADLKDLSRRSRRAHGSGALVVACAMLAVPVVAFVATSWPSFLSWAAVAALALTGGLFVRFAHLAGQSRGAYRKLFRELQQASGRAGVR